MDRTFSFDAPPTAAPVFFRSYSRSTPSGRESYQQVTKRCVQGFEELGLDPMKAESVRRHMEDGTALPSGRWLWVGGTPWISRRANYSGAYNCTSLRVTDIDTFGELMNLAMQGTGTGAVLEFDCVGQLPPIANHLEVSVVGEFGDVPRPLRYEHTRRTIRTFPDHNPIVHITVGDSRHGWVQAYVSLLHVATDLLLKCPDTSRKVQVVVDVSHVRRPGERLEGFGGIANPIKLPEMFNRVAAIVNKAFGRQLTPIECCLVIDEAALVVVAGNVRRSAGMRQFSSDDLDAADAKANLWTFVEGKWMVDPERDALRMANHTRVFHRQPTYEQVLASVTKQFHSGEGAIQYAPEAIARGNADILHTRTLKEAFLCVYAQQGRKATKDWMVKGLADTNITKDEIEHRMNRYGLNPCGEIIGTDFHCNLAEVHLNRLSDSFPSDVDNAFRAATYSVGILLRHQFESERHAQSRAWDPIVGVSFTGLFDWMVDKLGVAWLEWWSEGRPRGGRTARIFREFEADVLTDWRTIVHDTLKSFCAEQGLRMPNRYTTVQPAGSKSLLTGASPGWHPPKAPRFIRRITFAKGDPIAMACIDLGYSVVPGQGDKDENGTLLDNPFDERCTEWLVEMPVAAPWADLHGADEIDINGFSATAQFDFYMQVQRHYTTHNTSATIEFREREIPLLAQAIHQAIATNSGYISAALLARHDANVTFPRMPFEPIDKATYDRLVAEMESRKLEKGLTFEQALARYDRGVRNEAGPAGCDSDKCLFPVQRSAPQEAAGQ